MSGWKSLPPLPMAPPRLVVVARAGARLTREGDEGTAAHPAEELARRNGASLRAPFGRTAAHRTEAAEAGSAAGRLTSFHHVVAPPERMADLAAQFRQLDDVEAAYLKPSADVGRANAMLPAADPAPLETPDFTLRQGYLNAAPEGIDARFAWNYAGGRGSGIRILDIEGAWQTTHEDLGLDAGMLAGGRPLNDPQRRSHGSAALGVIGARPNGFGIMGIASDAELRGISPFGDDMTSAMAIHRAANLLAPGDILLIEMHRPGPRFGFDETKEGQLGFIALEWWPDDQAAIQYATARGILVVEAAGNGAENLDDAIYDANPAPPAGPFPAFWRNPFRRTQIDTGAILVGAGAPPPGTHGKSFGANCGRMPFSNFGSALDAQAWGDAVTTCGFGDLQGGDSEDQWYTDSFSGTSSAAPIVARALACMQGALRGAGLTQLGPLEARQLLRGMGTPQPGGAERIGNRPDLRAILLHRIGRPQS